MILNYKLITNSDKTLVAFSGGKDSVVLLAILLKKYNKENIAIAHINHQIRENSDLDAIFSKNIAQKYGIKYFEKSLGLNDIKSNIEAIARNERYQALQEIAIKNGYNKIATAHTKSDNIEQFFIKLYRGTSLSGLGGIKEIKEMIIRPLLGFTSNQVKEYIKTNKLNHIEDETNSKDIYLRNKIRNTILPKINIENYDLDTHIINLMSQIEQDNKYFDGIIDKFIAKNIHIFKDFLFFDKYLLLKQPDSIKSRLLNTLLYRFFNVNTNYKKITEMINLMTPKERHGRASQREKKIQISQDINLHIDQHYIAISKQYSRGRSPCLPNRSPCLPNRSLCLSLSETEKIFNIIKDNIKYFRACKPSDLLEHEKNIKLINFTNGDKFQKYNNKTIKLKDIFIDHNIPIFLRKSWPILSLDNKIIAIPFLEKGYYYNPKNSTLDKNVKK